jgi:hypothetical protein
MANPRPLTREELAKFLPDQRSIRAFEQLFAIIPGDLIILIQLIEDVGIEAVSAMARAESNSASLLTHSRGIRVAHKRPCCV